MQIDKLQIELRPRSPAQALDLGFALLRSSPYAAYMSYAVLTLPFFLLAAALTFAFPGYADWIIYLPWWFQPMAERGTLYVLSRQVFGTSVSWQEAVRAWPRQLGGGMFSLLTWFRPFSAGRSFIQPIWQLENARGAVARQRRRTLGANGTASSAFWFGVMCACMELMLHLGLVYFITTLLFPEASLNSLFQFDEDSYSALANLCYLALTTAVTILFGPIYTACGFTLYLNRRAALEAWDIELKLRQITPPAARPLAARSHALAVALGTVLCLSLAGTPDVLAVPVDYPTEAACLKDDEFERLPTSDPEQQRVRRQLDQLYANDALRTSECVERWVRKNDAQEKKKERTTRAPPAASNLQALAGVLKVVSIAALLGAIAWLLYRYRDQFPAFRRTARVAVATEVGGLDIRPESLPPDIAQEAMRLWHAGQRRAALALLYRATLSRMVTDDKLLLRQGDTEGDCLRAATRACQEQRMAPGRLEVARNTTALWLAAAYGNRWPGDDQVHDCCQAWSTQFAPAATGSAA